MYTNIGAKIKGMAKVIFILGCIAGFIAGLLFGVQGGMFWHWLLGALIWVGASFLSWVLTWELYGYGELIEKTTEIAKNIKNETDFEIF